jgi:hypothetical protein
MPSPAKPSSDDAHRVGDHSPDRAATGADEFVDEQPGAYLLELTPDNVILVWSALNLSSTVVLGIVGWFGDLSHESEWFALTRLIWVVLPISATLVLVTALWHLASAYTRKAPGKLAFTFAATLASLLLWFGLRSWLADADLFAS